MNVKSVVEIDRKWLAEELAAFQLSEAQLERIAEWLENLGETAADTDVYYQLHMMDQTYVEFILARKE